MIIFAILKESYVLFPLQVTRLVLQTSGYLPNHIYDHAYIWTLLY